MQAVITRNGLLRFTAALTGAVAIFAGGMAATPEPASAAPAATSQAPGGGDGTWVSAWTASMQGPSTLGALGVELLSGHSVIEAVQDFVPPPKTFSNQTIRQVMYLHEGGSQMRIKLSNQFGEGATRFPSVTIGLREGNTGASIVPGTLREVTFDGKRSVTIPKGQTVLSDPVDLPVDALDSVVLSMFVPSGNGPATVHGSTMQTRFVTSGDRTRELSSEGYTEHGFDSEPGDGMVPLLLGSLTTAGYYATGIQVKSADPEACTLVTFGDSITDGYMSSVNSNARYPDYLARRLQANPATDHVSVANMAISGNRVTDDGIGPSALHRLERDVLSLPDVCGVILHEGINDIGTAGFNSLLPVASDEIIAGYKAFASRMHQAGIPVYITTLQPAGNLLEPTFYGYYSTPIAHTIRGQVNNWVRTHGAEVFNGVIDFDAVTRDPANPEVFKDKYDSGDHLHPNDRGYKAMAKAIPQEILNHIASS